MQTTHVPSNRSTLLSRLARLVINRTAMGWIVYLHIGPAAGCGRWVLGRRLFLPTGWTGWIGRNVKGGRGDMYRVRPLSAGFTRNGNSYPWISDY